MCTGENIEEIKQVVQEWNCAPFCITTDNFLTWVLLQELGWYLYILDALITLNLTFEKATIINNEAIINTYDRPGNSSVHVERKQLSVFFSFLFLHISLCLTGPCLSICFNITLLSCQNTWIKIICGSEFDLSILVTLNTNPKLLLSVWVANWKAWQIRQLPLQKDFLDS